MNQCADGSWPRLHRQIMCLLWKQRQKKLGIDDFGRPLPESGAQSRGAE